MATKNTVKKSKLVLRAYENPLTEGDKTDYYVSPKGLGPITVEDLANDVATLGVRHEDPADLIRIWRAMHDRASWYITAGYTLTDSFGSYRLTSKGTLTKSELTSAPDRARLTLGVSFAMGSELRNAIDGVELAVEIEKPTTGPQLYTAVSGQDYENPEAVTRGESVPISSGGVTIVTGKSIKVGGEGPDIGLTLTRIDGDEGTTYFFTPKQLFPNTGTRVGFVMPTDAPDGSIWQVKICTQLGSNSSNLLKTPRTAVMEDYFVVGQTSTVEPEEPEDPQPGGGSGEDQEEDPLA